MRLQSYTLLRNRKHEQNRAQSPQLEGSILALRFIIQAPILLRVPKIGQGLLILNARESREVKSYDFFPNEENR
jgi:hypothetical protein